MSKPLQSIVCVLGIVLGPGIEHSPFPHGAYVLFVKSLCDSAFMSCELPSDNSWDELEAMVLFLGKEPNSNTYLWNDNGGCHLLSYLNA